ncbi:MAG: PH domain-containing protein [Candidatus Hydrogenedentes bacterium]|nr:PH domain-containing protein [Candidatus Hydrogenedentota bacterium]
MSPTHGFHMEFKPVFLFTYVLGAVVGSIAIMLWRMLDASLQMVPYSVVLDTIGYYLIFIAPFYAGVCGLVMSRYFKYVITEDGICGQNLIGASRFVEWDSIAEIRPIKIGNLAFVRLVTEEKKPPMWLPLFISDEQVFGGALLDCAPEGNAIRGLVRTIHLAA